MNEQTIDCIYCQQPITSGEQTLTIAGDAMHAECFEQFNWDLEEAFPLEIVSQNPTMTCEYEW